MPYIYSESLENHQRGLYADAPLCDGFRQRPPTHWNRAYEYMFGPSLLVAPLLSQVSHSGPFTCLPDMNGMISKRV
jgi:alpha-glucosidase (family GH31 glycosyl hydrolase)